LVYPKEEVGFGWWFAGYLAAGGAAGATALTFVYPLEFAYTRLAADTTGKFNGLGSCLGSIYKTEGINGLYRGFGPSVCGIIIYRAGYFGFYDAGKAIIFGEDGNPNFLSRFILALNVDIAAATFAYPIDTIRRRLMMQSGKAAADVQYTTMSGCISHIMKNEGGVMAFYKGCFANNTRAIASALVLVLYDELKEYFK
jgi:solute carrier family 25 (adenine nucleotide translocator) protein 4/5/6/31